MPVFGQPHSALQRNARHLRLGADVPVMLVQPEDQQGPCPLLIWMHGRTAEKELDPGRYLRLMRRGIATCAIDLPGHGERLDSALHEPKAVLRIVEQMAGELDGIIEDLRGTGSFDPDRIAVGGISAGGMAALVRCCNTHAFAALCLEATTGNLSHRASASFADPERLDRLDPITHLDGWREIPLLVLHNRHDAWIDIDGQHAFIRAMRDRYEDPEQIRMHVYEELTGAPFEHAGFGRFSADAKDRMVRFLLDVFGMDE